MKSIVFVAVVFSSFAAKAQTVNWASDHRSVRHLASGQLAIDNALTYSVQYGYRLKSKQQTIINLEYTAPFGKTMADDFNIKTGAQIMWMKKGNFYFASEFRAELRRFENSYSRLVNIGADVSTTIGYYRKHWFIAAEAGFDKAILTHFKHSKEYKEIFPAVKDGWYEPSTGGILYSGVRLGYSTRNCTFYLKAGRKIEQDFQTQPLLPFYAQIGFVIQFKTIGSKK
ncbi:hypothetical protein [Lacibacter sediminis]|uniref:DUF2490 domain-containing protein n=1 Tax=Lacibacter sediminis TaxID=2760713 RepID=A0A7G5XDC6_9BACT|nr:hypothetical protein [Lacibacter sediminis]QNA43479.1 hypothetical protein H4075_15510 [Lacibacter sediminis]